MKYYTENISVTLAEKLNEKGLKKCESWHEAANTAIKKALELI